jgi:hypothetical protein
MVCGICELSAAATAKPPAPPRLVNLAGEPEPFVFGSEVRAVVFLFLSVECPISNSYAPEIRRLGTEFGPQNVLVRLVYPNPDETTDAVRQHGKDFELAFPALRDPWHDLVKMSGVHLTPEAAVYVPKRGFVYHGRIDNRYADLGVARPAATEHDLKEALKAVLENKPVPHAFAQAVGCSIAPLSDKSNR